MERKPKRLCTVQANSLKAAKRKARSGAASLVTSDNVTFVILQSWAHCGILELANARLIAAAPELLESLKYMVAVSNWATTIQSEEQYDEMIATAEAAIRKVEGR